MSAIPYKVGLLISYLYLACFFISCDDPEVEGDCRLIRMASPYFSSDYTYDDAGHIIRIDYVYGTTPENTLGSTTLVSYDEQGRIATMASSENRYSEFFYPDDRTIIESLYYYSEVYHDWSTSVWRYEFDDQGLLLKQVDTLNTNRYYRYEFDSNGNMSRSYFTQTGEAGEVLQYEYTSWDNRKHFPNHFNSVILIGTPFSSSEIYTTFIPRPAPHNMLAGVQYDANENPHPFNYSYSYNSAGYPVKSGAIVFEYECQ